MDNVAQSKKLTKNNEGVTVPSLAFFHIPLPEYEEVWNTKICYGEKREEITAPRVNSGLFTAMVEMGDVLELSLDTTIRYLVAP